MDDLDIIRLAMLENIIASNITQEGFGEKGINRGDKSRKALSCAGRVTSAETLVSAEEGPA
jgi:hypothetical protein